MIFIYSAKKQVRRQLIQSLESISLRRQQRDAFVLYCETQTLSDRLQGLLEVPWVGRRSDRPDFEYPYEDLMERPPMQELDSFQAWLE